MLASPLEVVVRLTTAVGTARTLAEVFDATLEALRAGFSIDRAAILLSDADGVMRFTAWRGLSDTFRTAVDGHTPWSPGPRAPAPIVVADVQHDPSCTGIAGDLERERIQSLAFVPLVAGGGVIGAILLVTPIELPADQLEPATAIGFLIGYAVEQTQRAVTAQRERERLLFALDAASMGTWDWNLTTQRVEWSDNLERIHGLPEGSFDGTFASYQREIHPDDQPRVASALETALREDRLHDVEYRIVGPDGTARWAHGKGRVERDSTGAPVGMTGVCMDITARKQVEADNARLFDEAQRLLAQEAALRDRLTTLTDGSNRLLTALSAEGVVTEVLGLGTRVLPADGVAVWRRFATRWHVVGSRGLSEEFVSATLTANAGLFSRPLVVTDLTSPAVPQERLAAYTREGVTSLVAVPLTIRGEVSGGMTFYHRSRHAPTEGELRVAVALGHLTAAAISNAELYEEQRELRTRAEAAQKRTAFLAEASAMLSSLDFEANLRAVAQLAVARLADCCIVDLREEEGLKRLAIAHADPARIALVEELYRRYPTPLNRPRSIGQVLRTGEPELYAEISEQALVRAAADEEHFKILREIAPTSMMVVPLIAGRRVLGTILFVNVTPERCFEAADLEFATELGRRAGLAIENARLYHEAQAANRSKDEFLATLSHELRTPLNVIIGRARMLGTAPDLDSARQMSLVVHRNSLTLLRLVEDLLDVSSMTVGQIKLERQDVSLAVVVETAAQAVQNALEAKSVTLTIDAAPGLPPVIGDATRLQQIVWNLLSNAAKFTPAGGTIAVSVAARDREVELTVRDSGEGISAEALPHIFDMFWQSDRSYSRLHGGLGLGLSIVRKLVELHGGKVQAESAGRGCGATFTVRLPCAAPIAEGVTAVAMPEALR